MRQIGTAEAMAHFTEILRAAELGETITITRHGMAVAILGPAPRERVPSRDA